MFDCWTKLAFVDNKSESDKHLRQRSDKEMTNFILNITFITNLLSFQVCIQNPLIGKGDIINQIMYLFSSNNNKNKKKWAVFI